MIINSSNDWTHSQPASLQAVGLESAADTAIAQSQPVPAAVGKHTVFCNTCLEQVEWKNSRGCDKCNAYHHKVGRNKDGCTREGWSKAGVAMWRGV